MVYMHNFWPSEISWCVDNASLKDDDDIQRQVKNHYTVQQTNSEELLISALLQYKTLDFVPIAWQCMLANCRTTSRRPVWSAYVLHITMPIELCITCPELLVFAHTRIAIVSGPLMSCWETTCIDLLPTMTIFIQLFYSIASNVWCFLQILIFPQLFSAPVWWKPNAVVVRELFWSLRLISFACVK